MSDDLTKKHRDANMTTRIFVRDIMNSPVISCSPNDSIKDIAENMKNEKIGSIVVSENDFPLGLITDWDIVSKGVIRDTKPSLIKASEVMQTLFVIESDKSITEAARTLRKNNIKRLGVVYKNKLVGIISASDVISVTPDLIDVISEKSSIIRGEVGRESGNISGFCDDCNEWSDLLQYDDGTFLCEECRGELPDHHQA